MSQLYSQPKKLWKMKPEKKKKKKSRLVRDLNWTHEHYEDLHSAQPTELSSQSGESNMWNF